jgi:hypothetical protein
MLTLFLNGHHDPIREGPEGWACAWEEMLRKLTQRLETGFGLKLKFR